MTEQDYVIDGRTFRTKSDYARGLHDKKTIDELKQKYNLNDPKAVESLKCELERGKYRFYTLLGEDFKEELEGILRTGGKGITKKDRSAEENRKKRQLREQEVEAYVQLELHKREKRRKIMMTLCGLLAILCLGYVGVYSWYDYRTGQSYQQMSDLKENPIADQSRLPDSGKTEFTLDQPEGEREVLEEYKNLLNINKRLIGWVKIDDTNIDYPVMQTVDNEYYLDHNLEQEYDKNGSIFMDKDCDAMKPSTNLIIYGHHMKNGQMFGKLHLYQEYSYYEKHPTIQFDTIYEKGTYEIMYVFRSKVYSEQEIVFKYYQFIDAGSELAFNSYMKEMASMSFYDTGVTASYGDHLLTLSTCDYQEKNGRFVVVAKKTED